MLLFRYDYSAITAWSRSGSKGAAQKAEVLLKKMEELHEAGNSNLQPSAQIYTSVISAWVSVSLCNAALCDMQILTQLIKSSAYLWIRQNRMIPALR